MSVMTRVESPGLARDSAPEVGSGANALRRAENVVIRSPGVIETRPSFELLYEDAATTARVRALREFQSACLAALKDSVSGDWSMRRLDSGVDVPGQTFVWSTFEPPNYDQSETKYAEARGNLYMTSKHGVAALESVSATARFGGVDAPPWMTDYNSPVLAGSTVPAFAYAYRFVLARKDSNGYVRRSPPSHRLVVTLNSSVAYASGTFATGARLYLGKRCAKFMSAGDTVECYRSRITAGLAARAEHYLAWTYTLTSVDIGRLYFVPPADATQDDDLGAELYTDTSQTGGGEIAAKYPPPASGALALFQRVMWYGRVVEKARAVITMNRFFRVGAGEVQSTCIGNGTRGPSSAVYNNGSTTVTVADTAGLSKGMYWTDNLKYGPHEPTLGLGIVPADTTIVSITNGTDFVISNAAVCAASPTSAQSGVQSPDAPDGLIAETQTGTYTSGSPIVISLTTTAGLREGMYWTDNAYGPEAAGAKVPAGTKILTIDSANQVTLTANATATGAATSYYGDVITISGVDFYAWISYGGDYTMIDPWTALLSNHYVKCVAIGAPDIHASARWLAAVNLTKWIQLLANYTDPFAQTTVRVVGDFYFGHASTWATIQANPQPSNLAQTVVVEELLVNTGVDLTTSCTCPLGIAPENPITQDAASKPNRVYFSDIDEPESVPLLNYIDIGAAGSAILALVPLRNALLVFKSDGVWRITGSGPSAWSVDPLDPTMRLLRPEAVCVSQNKAYAWCDDGIQEVSETDSRSLTAGRLDVELRTRSEYLSSNTTHGVFAAAVPRRNIVLFGLPTNLYGQFTDRVLCYHQTTNAWTEWPVSWGKVAEGGSYDRLYQSRPEEAAGTGTAEIDVEVRRMLTGIVGRDRSYDLGNTLVVSGTVLTISDGDFGTWRPTAGDWISATDGATRVFRRILSATHAASTWTITLEAIVATDAGGLLITDAGVFFVTDGGVFFLISDLYEWQAHEAVVVALEWHPTAPKRLPTGALVRELQFELDLREAPTADSSIPEYVVGGSSERDTSPYTLTSNMARVATVQMLRTGVSRQIARGATIAPYFQTSDIFAVRVVGASIVHEGTSERTRR